MVFLFCANFLWLFSDQVRGILFLNNLGEKGFLILLFGVFALAGLWSFSELLFFRQVALEDGYLVIRRGLMVVHMISYEAITRLQATTEQMERNQTGLLRNAVWYRGEKLIIRVGEKEVVLRSIYINDYDKFKQKLVRLAINAKLFGPAKFHEQTQYGFLIIVSLFVLLMIYINLFGRT
ncbi:hypothetical protein F0P96_02185 [Hymenobacter busanensis]|uniref:Uncharacterized protein n=1 Tax=Hymenobacter busanensis TaxID=2607656 RepID=A0A7L4ZUD5_9BACT|nr:hypothetical protein F0P96_02185 [Hymenobacter busanensis]QHJ06791.1 hypothetical protein GUY19_05565 [Hymenobacter busanensis]